MYPMCIFNYSYTLLMEFRVLKKKLMFLHHLVNLPEPSLAKEVLTLQVDNDLPGIFKECKGFLNKFNIGDLSLYTKNQFKRIVNESINNLNRQRLIDQVKVKQYKKISLTNFENEKFEVKSYLTNLNVSDARLKFKIISHMVPTIKMNFQSEPAYARNLWACDICLIENGIGLRDSQSHILICPAYESFRHGKNLECDSDLVDYYKLVLKERSNT